MSRPSTPGKSTLTVRPELDEWIEIDILAKLDKRNMANELLALAHAEFSKRFPRGIQDYLQTHPDYQRDIKEKETL